MIVDCLRADRAFAQAKLEPDGFLGQLVRRGRSFTNAVTVTPTTTPAVASMLTGRYPYEHGLRGLLGFTLPPAVPTVMRSLREAGYWTEADVTGPLVEQLHLFDDFDDYKWSHRREASVHEQRGETLAARVRELQSRERPWFALWHLWELHEPRQVPRSFKGKTLSGTVYDRALAALDDRLARLFPEESLTGVTVCLIGDHGENLRFEPRGQIGKGIASLLWFRSTRWLTQPLARKLISRGAHSSSKRLLRGAPRHIITHGHHLFEPLLRVPYILAGDNITPGTSGALVTHVDLAPTFAAFGDGWFDGGAGALPLPLDGDGDPDRRVVLETAWATPLQGVRQVGLRTRRWKYMELEEGGAPALYDLEADPGERRNLAERRPDVAEELRTELHSRIAEPEAAGEMSAADASVVENRLRDLGYL